MKFLGYAFLTSLLLFAWSVCVLMLNFSADEELTVMGISPNYFMLPLLMCNIAILALNRFWFPHGGISFVVFMWLIIVSFVTALNAVNLAFDLIKVTLWPTTYFASYLLYKKDPSFIKKIKYAFFVIFVMSTVYFVIGKEIQNTISKMGIMTSANSVFCVITVLPFLLLLKNKGLSLVAIIVTFLCVIFSNKRSAVLAFAVALLPTLYGLFGGIKSKGKRAFIIVAISTAAIIFFNYLVNNYLDGQIFERFQSIEEDGGSGRIDIWTNVLNAYRNSGLVSQIFGHGHLAVSSLGDASAAHNDFLEILYDYGIFAFIIYLLLHRSIIKKVLLLRRLQPHLFASYFFFAVIFIVMSWVSILIPQQRYIIYMAIFMAYTEVETNSTIS